MRVDAGGFRKALRLSHQCDGLQHIEAADRTGGDVYACAALDGCGLDAIIEGGVGKRTDGDDDQVAARAQHRLGDGTHALHGRGFHDHIGLQREQLIDAVHGAAAHAVGEGLRGRLRPAGDAQQLVVRQQAFGVCVGDDAAQKAAAHDDKPLHSDNPFSCGAKPHLLSLYCTMTGRKRKAPRCRGRRTEWRAWREGNAASADTKM